MTIIALLPPSSSNSLPSRPATIGPTARPIRVLPVALISATRRSRTSASPIAASPSTIWDRSAGASPNSANARANRFWQASAVSGVFSDGFQSTGSPHTMASAKFHDHTATGQLKALITPTGPSGCQVSIIRWPGRSDARVRP